MTPHTPSQPADDQPGHPELELLADLAEDLLPPARATELHAHLADCPECADTYAAFAEVRELLADTPAPPMPPKVAARIDAALAAEAAARAETARAAEAAIRTQAQTTARAETPAPTPSPATTTEPTEPTEAPGSRPHPRRRRRLLAGALGLAAALAIGTLVGQLDGSAPSTAGPSAGAAAQAPVGPAFTADNLAPEVRRLFPPRETGKPSTGANPEIHGLATPADPGTPDTIAVPEPCLAQAVGHPGAAPLASTKGSYQGTPVLALVYPLPDQPADYDVYLVTPGCPGATVLLHQTVPAH
ncbi:hypothetical protein CFP65_3767 [Kitasatospora sp. MMS16-BH015]|uniref:anti-sigma factor family protein n=1 Tax=Kitasatospora sp. MMS16-BH015 TaxID=2018025 RepID=UPI000CA0F2E9|nr:hypothetical protein [Kitasatospora sp. MMS16-BH015]AUG78550.1 hypothetical protein CFP65_3767 [Kitasatospora sp. MMS16-BH015]